MRFRTGDPVDVQDDFGDWSFAGFVRRVRDGLYELSNGMVVREYDLRPHRVELFGVSMPNPRHNRKNKERPYPNCPICREEGLLPNPKEDTMARELASTVEELLDRYHPGDIISVIGDYIREYDDEDCAAVGKVLKSLAYGFWRKR